MGDPLSREKPAGSHALTTVRGPVASAQVAIKPVIGRRGVANGKTARAVPLRIEAVSPFETAST